VTYKHNLEYRRHVGATQGLEWVNVTLATEPVPFYQDFDAETLKVNNKIEKKTR